MQEHLVDLPRLQRVHAGKDPRDAHFITSRICGICGDNHATCSVYAQNMAFGDQDRRRWPSGSSTSARRPSTCSTTTSSRTTWSFVDFCEQMVKETNPGVLAQGGDDRGAARRHPRLPDDRRHHAGVQPVHRRDLPRGAADEPADARDVLPDGGPARPPLDALPRRRRHGRRRRSCSPTTSSRLMRYVDFVKKVVPLHDDLFDFFYEALPGYEEVGRRRDPARLLGRVPGPRRRATTRYETHERRGAARCSSRPGIVVDGELVTTDLVDINLGIRILLGSSFYDDWAERGDVRQRTTRSATRSTSATRGTRRRMPEAAEARPRGRQVQLGDVPALVRQADRRPPARSTPAAGRSPGSGRRRSPGIVDTRVRQGDRARA